jgi:hypothetical protein
MNLAALSSPQGDHFMATAESQYCPECEGAFDYPAAPPVDRRDFLRLAGAGVAAVAAGSSLKAAEAPAATKKVRPAEELVRELTSTLDDTQKKRIMLPYNHGTGKDGKGGTPARLGMYNAAYDKVRLQDVYKKSQIELVERIVKAMSNGDDGYRLVSRGGTWDATKAFENTGAHIFGDPAGKEPWAFMFSGHHLTIRCDGNFADGVAFGGPIYYGHTPYGYSDANLFYYQTKSVLSVFDALDGKQREKAIVKGSPGEGAGSVKFKTKDEERPGILYKDLSKDQQALVEKVMRDVLSPFRKEDCDEVMEVIKKTGGMEKIHLAFYAEMPKPDGAKVGKKEKDAWSFWRLEGPGFVWNYRVLDHVHTYVNISSKLA